MKACTICGVTKPESDYYRSTHGLRSACKDCTRTRRREMWAKAHPVRTWGTGKPENRRTGRTQCECCESAPYVELVMRNGHEQRMCAECAALHDEQERERRRRYTAEISVRSSLHGAVYGGAA